MPNKIHFMVDNEAYFINLKQSTMLIVNFNSNSRMHLKLIDINRGNDWIVLEAIINNEHCIFEYENITIKEGWKNGFQTK